MRVSISLFFIICWLACAGEQPPIARAIENVVNAIYEVGRNRAVEELRKQPLSPELAAGYLWTNKMTNGAHRVLLFEMLAQCSPGILEQREFAGLPAWIATMSGGDPSAKSRSMAVNYLGMMLASNTVNELSPLIFRALMDPDAGVSACARQVVKMNRNILVPQLVQGLASPDPYIVTVCCEDLGCLRSRSGELVDALTGVLSTNDWTLVVAAANALGKFRDAARGSLPELRRAAIGGNAAVKNAMESAIDRIDVKPKAHGKWVAIMSFSNLEYIYISPDTVTPEFIRTRLAKSEDVDLVERFDFEKTDYEKWKAAGKPSGSSIAMELGQSIGADYIMSGSVNTVKTNLLFSCALTSCRTGQAKELSFSCSKQRAETAPALHLDAVVGRIADYVVASVKLLAEPGDKMQTGVPVRNFDGAAGVAILSSGTVTNRDNAHDSGKVAVDERGNFGKRVAIMPFADSYGYVSREGTKAALLLFARLAEDRDVELVERTELDKLSEELRMSAYHLSDPGNTLKLGKILGADYILTGIVGAMDDKIHVVCKITNCHTGQTKGSAFAYDKILGWDASMVSAGSNIADFVSAALKK